MLLSYNIYCFSFLQKKINILTSKQIRQWSWIQNNPLWETQNMKKKISTRKVILHWIVQFTRICTTSYCCVGTELSHCMLYALESCFNSSDHFLHSECKEIYSCWQEAPNPIWLHNPESLNPLKICAVWILSCQKWNNLRCSLWYYRWLAGWLAEGGEKNAVIY